MSAGWRRGAAPPPERLSAARLDFSGAYLAALLPGFPANKTTIGVVTFEVAQDLTPAEFEAFLAEDERSWGLCVRSESRPSSRARSTNMLLVVDGKLPIWAAARLAVHFVQARRHQREKKDVRVALAFRALLGVPSMVGSSGGAAVRRDPEGDGLEHELAVVVACDEDKDMPWEPGCVVPLPWRPASRDSGPERPREAVAGRVLVWDVASGHLSSTVRSDGNAIRKLPERILRLEIPRDTIVVPATFKASLDQCLDEGNVNGAHVVLDGAMATWMAAWASTRLLREGARVVSVRDANSSVERIVRCDCGNYPSGGVAVVVGQGNPQQATRGDGAPGSSWERTESRTRRMEPKAGIGAAEGIVPFPCAPVGGHIVLIGGDPEVGKSSLAGALEGALQRRVPGRVVRLARRIVLNPDGEGLWARETSGALRDAARRALPFSDEAIATWLTRAMAARRQFRVVVGDLGGMMGNDTIRAVQLATAVVHIEHTGDEEPRWRAEAWKALAPTSTVRVIRVAKRKGERVESELAVIAEPHGCGPTLAVRVVEQEQDAEDKGRRTNDDSDDWTQRLAAFLYGAPLLWSRRAGSEPSGGWRVALQRLVGDALPTLRESFRSSDRNTDPALLSALGAVTWHVACVCAWGAGSPPLGAPKEVLEACVDLAAAPACIGLPADIGYDVARLAKVPGDGDCPEGLHAALIHFHESRLASDRKELLLDWLGSRVRTLSSAEE